MLEPLQDESTVGLRIFFGAVSILWTSGFLTDTVPLWPAFVGSATFFARGRGRSGLGRAVASNLIGVAGPRGPGS